MNVFLIGYRCTGKTSVGEALAGALGWPFVDTDRMIVDASGQSIARMIAGGGWAMFRKREHDVLKAVCGNHHQVVATGGGIVLDADNRLAMQHAGTVVWLTASRKTIQSRMRNDETTAGNRPSITSQGVLEEIASVLAERRPLYEMAADLVIDTDRSTIEEICTQIIEALRIPR